MLTQLFGVFAQSTNKVKAKLFSIYGVLLAFNVLTWSWAWIAFHDFPVLLGTCMMAYGFGLRHAVDADHIAAIDNVTRKLMQENKRPVAVGFFFSLGHSSLVVLVTLVISFATVVLKNNLSQYRELGGVIGTAISALFLFSIALMNLVVLIAIFRAWRRLKDGGVYVDDDFNLLLAGRGFIARILRPMFRLISESWHMFPLGLLFGLGFDTATEVGLLGLSATQVSHGMSPWAIMVFPALFSAGMSLLDTLDGHLMLGAYGWSYMKPVRKIYYNMTITLVSVVVAIVVGGIEALGLFAEQFKLEGRIWNAIGALNENFGTLGYAIIGIFMFSWVLSMLIYRVKRFDEFVVVSTAGG